MNTHSYDFTSIEQYNNCVAKMAPGFISRLFCTNQAAKCATGHEGLKSNLILQEFQIEDLARRWNCSFECKEGIWQFVPRVLEIHKAKADFCLCPQDEESTWLAYLRKKGQDPTDWPLQAYILDKTIKKIQEEINVALWAATQTSTPQPDDALINMFNGWLAIACKEIEDGNLALLPGEACIVDTIEAMEDQIDDCHAENPENLVLFLNRKQYNQYYREYRNKYGKYCCTFTENGMNGLMTDAGTKLKWMTGLKGQTKMILTFDGNLHHGYDAMADESLVRLQQDKRQLCGWIDFNIGAQIGLVDDNCLVVADQPVGKAQPIIK